MTFQSVSVNLGSVKLRGSSAGAWQDKLDSFRTHGSGQVCCDTSAAHMAFTMVTGGYRGYSKLSLPSMHMSSCTSHCPAQTGGSPCSYIARHRLEATIVSKSTRIDGCSSSVAYIAAMFKSQCRAPPCISCHAHLVLASHVCSPSLLHSSCILIIRIKGCSKDL